MIHKAITEPSMRVARPRDSRHRPRRPAHARSSTRPSPSKGIQHDLVRRALLVTTCWNGGHEFQDALTPPEPGVLCSVQHPWMENDCLFADIILPTSHDVRARGLRRRRATAASGTPSPTRSQAVDPVGRRAHPTTRPWSEVARALEKLGGVYEDLVRAHDDARQRRSIDWIEEGLPRAAAWRPSDTVRLRRGSSRTAIKLFPTEEKWEAKPAGLIGFYEDPENNPLLTPSGKIEYYSHARWPTTFPDDKVRGPVAHWIEKGDGHDDRDLRASAPRITRTSW